MSTEREKGYGWPHQKRRESLKARVASGLVACARCGETIQPGEPWDLGHDDFDRSVYKGPEHRVCNRRAAGRASHLIVRDW